MSKSREIEKTEKYVCVLGIFYLTEGVALCYGQFALCSRFLILLVWSLTQK